MHPERLYLTIFALLSLLSGVPARAHVSTIAITGDDAVGIVGAAWDQFDRVTINDLGAVAFRADLQHSGAVASGNDVGVWLFDPSGAHLLARTGAGNVPGAASTDYLELDTPLLSTSGEVIVGGQLDVPAEPGTAVGIWRFESSGGSLVARTGSGGVPQVPGANYDRFPATPGSLADDGSLAFVGVMEVIAGGVVSSTDRGVWRYDADGGELIAREGQADVPSMLGTSFKNFGETVTNSNDQVAFVAALPVGGQIEPRNATGIWRYNGTNGELLLREGVGQVPGQMGVDFTVFEAIRMNNVGHVVVDAQVDDLLNAHGVWLYDDVAGTQVASQMTLVPGVVDARFEEFDLQSVSDAGTVLVSASLQEGFGGVTSDNRHGVWTLNGTEQLIARTGSGNVPGVGNASFAAFTSLALNETGQVAFAADLQIGGDVDAANDHGIWIVDPSGESTLVAREGDSLAGKVIASLAFAGEDSLYETDGFNDRGELAFQASFTDGDSGLFLYRPNAADFDTDGDVDGDDLNEWQLAYAVASDADADLDGDSDGADLLIWQREFAGAAPLAPVAVPEPASFVMLCLGLCGALGRRN